MLQIFIDMYFSNCIAVGATPCFGQTTKYNNKQAKVLNALVHFIDICTILTSMDRCSEIQSLLHYEMASKANLTLQVH